MSNEIIDLEMDKDGSYAPKGKPKHKVEKKEEVKSDMDNFLHGIDMGLDFIDKVVPRIKRISKLRG